MGRGGGVGLGELQHQGAAAVGRVDRAPQDVRAVRAVLDVILDSRASRLSRRR
jgi:hypothetical protein